MTRSGFFQTLFGALGGGMLAQASDNPGTGTLTLNQTYTTVAPTKHEIKVNGMTIEFTDDLEVVIEGTKVSIKSRTPYYVWSYPIQYYPNWQYYNTIPNSGSNFTIGGLYNDAQTITCGQLNSCITTSH